MDDVRISTPNPSPSLVDAFGLRRDPAGRWWFGVINGYPVALCIFTQSDRFSEQLMLSPSLGPNIPRGATADLSVQVRFVLDEKAEPSKLSVPLPERVDALRQAGAVKVNIEPTIAWCDCDLTKFESPLHVHELLLDFVGAFPKAGLLSGEGLCHVCRAHAVSEPMMKGGRVALVCADCLQQRVSEHQSKSQQQLKVSSGLIARAAACSLVCALCWGLIWGGGLVFMASGSNYRLFSLLALCFILCLIAFQSVFSFFDSLSGVARGSKLIAGLIGSIAAIAVGDVIAATILLVSNGQGFNPLLGVVAGALLWFKMPALVVLARLITAGTVVVMAGRESAGPKPRLAI